jgi:hypothetical protein
MSNFERVYLEARASRPGMTQKWKQRIYEYAGRNGCDLAKSPMSMCHDVPPPSVYPNLDNPNTWYQLLSRIECLETVPRIPKSSSSSSSSSSNESSVEDEPS